MLDDSGFDESTNIDLDLDPTNRKKSIVLKNYVKTSDFINALNDISDDNKEERENLTRKYLNSLYTLGQDQKIQFGRNPLEIHFDKNELENLSGDELPDLTKSPFQESLILIEFFTHCCVNCLHSIEDVRQVYQEIMHQKDDINFQVVSIHSPKFTRERETASIRAFITRMKMEYSLVVNDPNCYIWNTLGITCWPTLLILGPNPSRKSQGLNLLFTLMGEGHKHVLQNILKSSLGYLQDKMALVVVQEIEQSSYKRNIKGGTTEDPNISSSFLKYPGKVTHYNEVLAISDTGNHRIIIANEEGSVKFIIGGIQEGNVDGDFSSCRFYYPQGTAFQNDQIIFVADTGNHAIRKIDLASGVVSTLISSDWSSIAESETIRLRSPWDISFYSPDILLICAAGNHRVFGYFFKTSTFLMTEHNQFSCDIIAGTGKEENRNNSYVLKASFAQPSGICVSKSNVIYIADSESSSIRLITTEGKGKVSALVGGARDPTDLFSYGDIDGKGVVAKLQHPMGVCSDAEKPNIYFVDTYNHKVKAIDLNTQICVTLTGVDDDMDWKLNEPGGISIDSNGRQLYIADTNHHVIKVINLSNLEIRKIDLTISIPLSKENKSLPKPDAKFFLNGSSKKIDDMIEFHLTIGIVPETFEGGQWRLISEKNGQLATGELLRDKDSSSANGLIGFKWTLEEQFKLVVDIFVCGPSSCIKRSINLAVFLNDNNPNDSKSNHFCYEPRPEFFN